MAKLYSRILEVFSLNLYLDVGYLHRGYASFSAKIFKIFAENVWLKPKFSVKIRGARRHSASTDVLQIVISLIYCESQYGEGHKMSQEMILHKQQTNLSHVRMKKIAQSRSEHKFAKALYGYNKY